MNWVGSESTMVVLSDQCEVGVNRQCMPGDVNRSCNQGIMVA